MPKAPITARTLFWEVLPDGSRGLVDWCEVTTSLGVMVEPRQLARPQAPIRDEDLVDSSFTSMTAIRKSPSGNYALDQVAFKGSQWPHYRVFDPGVE